MRVNQTNSGQVQSSESSGTSRAARAKGAQSTKKNEKTGAPVSAGDVSGANPQISSRGKEMSQAKAVASDAPEVREEKIAELRRRISEGRYQVDPEAIADRMLKEHIETADLG